MGLERWKHSGILKGEGKTIEILTKINSDFTTFKRKGNLAYFIILLRIIDHV